MRDAGGSTKPESGAGVRSRRERPRIVVTVQALGRAREPERARRRNERYYEALRRVGAEPVPIDEDTPADARRVALAAMDALLLSGGGDLDPELYGESVNGSVEIEPGRDALEREAWDTARHRRLPVLGICRGFQAINVFSGGGLVQDLPGHRGPADPDGAGARHQLRLQPGTRLARILRPTDRAAVLQVNTYHHQGVAPTGLAPGLVASGVTGGAGGELVEALESADPGDFVVGVQCHPERYESTPPEFERLWTVFADAARGNARGERVG